MNKIDKFLIRKIKILLIVVLLAAATGPFMYGVVYINTLIQNNIHGVPETLKNKLLKIYINGSVCSGTKLRGDVVLTAKHCVATKRIPYMVKRKGIKKLFLVYKDIPDKSAIYKTVDIGQEQTLEHSEYKFLKEHPTRDIALLVKKGKKEDIISFDTLNFTPVKRGTEVYVLGTNGFSKASEVKAKPITIDRVLFFNGFKSLWGEGLNIQGGTSGGAVVDKDGRIVGILVLGLGPILSGITPIAGLEEWFNKEIK